MPTSTPLRRLRGDLFGGLTAGIIALPLALAFGVASGLGPAAGLYGAFAVGLVAAAFGGTPTQISGPTGPMTVVVASAVVAFGGDVACVAFVILLAGALQVAYGAWGLGGMVRYIPYPVISGFMNGIGVIIILLQLGPLLGAPATSSPLAAVAALPSALFQASPSAVLLGISSMAIVFLTPGRISRVIPSPLIALVALTALSSLLKLDAPTIGGIPAGLPALRMPSFDAGQWTRFAGLAFSLSLLGSIDTLLTSLIADSMTRRQHDSRRELIGQGLGNMLASLIGGLAGAGATMRTVVNIKAGGTSRLSGIIHALFLLAVLLGLGPLASTIPLAVLAGILIKVGVDILDYRMLRLVRTAPRPDLAVMVAVFLVTVFVDLIVAVGVGVVLASLMLTWRTARQASVSISEEEPEPGRLDRERSLIEGSDQRIRVIDIRGPFFFGTAAQMQDKVDRLLGTRVVIVECLDVPFMDLSATFALGEMIEKLKSAGVTVVLAVGREQLETLRRCNIASLVGAEHVFHSHELALETARQLAEPCSPVFEDHESGQNNEGKAEGVIPAHAFAKIER
ncbi:MAG: SulP family inorganic anion transporter [Desulfovibrio sp.]